MKRGNRSPNRSLGSKYDWEEARVLYMTETPAINLKQVSIRTGIPYVQVRQKAAKERWSILRAQEQHAVMKSKRQDHMRRLAGESMKFDDDSIDTAKLGMNIVTSRLIEISRIYAATNQYNGGADAVIAKLQAGEPLTRGDMFSTINYKELRELAQAAQLFQEIGRKALGSEQTDESLFTPDEDVEKVVSIGGELTKDDDTGRLAAFLEALDRAGVMNNMKFDATEDADDEDTEDVRIVDGVLVPPPPVDAAMVKAIEAGQASTTGIVPQPDVPPQVAV
jgi:hypothetical protein